MKRTLKGVGVTSLAFMMLGSIASQLLAADVTTRDVGPVPVRTTTVDALQAEMRVVLDVLEARVGKRLRETGVKNAIIVLGRTGSGKSTLVTALGGSPLKAQSHHGELVLQGNLSPEVVIQHDGTGTRIPGSFYVATPHDVVVWDCPGFGSVEGALAQMVDAASISRVLGSSRRIKILLALSEESMKADRGSQVLLLLNQLSETFPDTTQLEQMVSLTITKTSPTYNHVARLKVFADDTTNVLTPLGRRLLNHLLTHAERRIAYLPEPTAEGAYPLDTAALWAKISGEFVERPTVRVELSAEARGYLGALSGSLNQAVVERMKESGSSVVAEFKRGMAGFSGTSPQLRQYLTDRVVQLEALRGVSGADVVALRRFGQMPGMKPDVARSIEQLLTLRGIAGGMDSVVCDSPSWFGALSDTLTWMGDIRDTALMRLEKDERAAERDKAQRELAARIAERDLITKERDRYLKERDARVDSSTLEALQQQLKQARADKTAEIKRLQEAHEARIADKDALIEASEERASATEALVEEKDGAITTLTQQVGVRHGEKERLEADLAEARDALAQQIRRTETAEKRASGLQRTIGALTAHRDKIKAELAHIGSIVAGINHG